MINEIRYDMNHCPTPLYRLDSLVLPRLSGEHSGVAARLPVCIFTAVYSRKVVCHGEPPYGGHAYTPLLASVWRVTADMLQLGRGACSCCCWWQLVYGWVLGGTNRAQQQS